MTRSPLIPLALAGTGAYLAWFAVRYWGSDVKWPSDPVKAVLTGKPLPGASGQASAQQLASLIESTAPAGPAPAHSGIYGITDIETLWTSQGGSSDTAFTAANVAMAESGGNPAYVSGDKAGLWGISVAGIGAGYTAAQLQDPGTSARLTIMHTVNGTSWAGWDDAVVTNGAYTGPEV